MRGADFDDIAESCRLWSTVERAPASPEQPASWQTLQPSRRGNAPADGQRPHGPLQPQHPSLGGLWATDHLLYLMWLPLYCKRQATQAFARARAYVRHQAFAQSAAALRYMPSRMWRWQQEKRDAWVTACRLSTPAAPYSAPTEACPGPDGAEWTPPPCCIAACC